MEIGERVQVKTFLFEGMATIDYIAIGELYPIQAELDEADEEGHKIKRITVDEIIQDVVLPKVNEQPTNGLLLAEIIKNDPGYGLYIGDQFLVGATRQNVGTHYYFYRADSLKFVGCMPVGIFRVVGLHNEPLIMQPVELIPIERPEQMNLFDFM